MMLQTGLAPPQQVSLRPGEGRTITQTIRIPNAKLWWPEDPNLHVLDTNTGGDSAHTRFGMREFRFDTPTRRAYLNGRIYFLRGSNITLHRFFEDPKSGALPWNEAWVRRLLVTIPKGCKCSGLASLKFWLSSSSPFYCSDRNSCRRSAGRWGKR